MYKKIIVYLVSIFFITTNYAFEKTDQEVFQANTRQTIHYQKIPTLTLNQDDDDRLKTKEFAWRQALQKTVHRLNIETETYCATLLDGDKITAEKRNGSIYCTRTIYPKHSTSPLIIEENHDFFEFTNY